MKKRIIKFFSFILGFSLALFLSVIVFTISEFIGIDLRLSEEASAGRSYLATFAVFIIALVLWMKFKSQMTLILFLLIIGGLYWYGNIYAHKIIKPFVKAEEYRNEASAIYDKWNNEIVTQANTNEYMKDQKAALDLSEKSTKLNFGYEEWISKYYQNIYQVRKEIFEQDEKIFKGELTLSEDQITNSLDSYNKRLQENYYITPFWMGFYGLDPIR